MIDPMDEELAPDTERTGAPLFDRKHRPNGKKYDIREAHDLIVFANALRNFLGLDPLYNDGSRAKKLEGATVMDVPVYKW